MKVEAAVQIPEEIRREFDALVESQSATCLWFMRNPSQISLADSAAEPLLAAIVRHGTQPAWQQAKRLQTWRSTHIK